MSVVYLFLKISLFKRKAVFVNIVAFEYNLLVEWSGRHLTPAGRRGKAWTTGEAEVGFFTRVKITFLSALAVFFHESENNLPLSPAESKCLERNGTGLLCFTQFKKQQIMRKQPKEKKEAIEIASLQVYNFNNNLIQVSL
jgi:hypothetical protein